MLLQFFGLLEYFPKHPLRDYWCKYRDMDRILHIAVVRVLAACDSLSASSDAEKI